jgi:hypothetical protein
VPLEIIKLKKKSGDLTGIRTGYLEACSIAPQPIKLPRTPKADRTHCNLFWTDDTTSVSNMLFFLLCFFSSVLLFLSISVDYFFMFVSPGFPSFPSHLLCSRGWATSLLWCFRLLFVLISCFRTCWRPPWRFIQAPAIPLSLGLPQRQRLRTHSGRPVLRGRGERLPVHWNNFFQLFISNQNYIRFCKRICHLQRQTVTKLG